MSMSLPSRIAHKGRDVPTLVTWLLRMCGNLHLIRQGKRVHKSHDALIWVVWLTWWAMLPWGTKVMPKRDVGKSKTTCNRALRLLKHITSIRGTTNTSNKTKVNENKRTKKSVHIKTNLQNGYTKQTYQAIFVIPTMQISNKPYTRQKLYVLEPCKVGQTCAQEIPWLYG